MLERAATGIVLVFVVLTINFALVRLAPGDPILYMISGLGEISPEQLEALRSYYGLDQPIYIQYIRYVERLLRGDFGFSYFYDEPVLTLILARVGNTMMIMVPSILLSLLLGTLLGVISSKRAHSKFDVLAQLSSVVGYSMPQFWTAILFVILFSVIIPIFPVTSAPGVGLVGLEKIISTLRRIIPPVFVLTIYRLAFYSRLTRASMLEELKKDYIITAWAKGCSERAVFYKHALKNALLPTVTIFGIMIPMLFAGAISVEIIFSWPGIGNLTYKAILNTDYNLITGIFLFISILVILGTALSDIVYVYLDPRIKYGQQG